jgi:hypothetical protein
MGALVDDLAPSGALPSAGAGASLSPLPTIASLDVAIPHTSPALFSCPSGGSGLPARPGPGHSAGTVPAWAGLVRGGGRTSANFDP